MVMLGWSVINHTFSMQARDLLRDSVFRAHTFDSN